jgi:hypothetical protein
MEKVALDKDKVALSPTEYETFRAILGSMNFMCMCTRLDIAFAVNVSYIRHAFATKVLTKQLRRLLRYLNGTRLVGITYGRQFRDNAYYIKVFSDLEWVEGTTTMRSQL